MIEINRKLYTQRIFATSTKRFDFFKPIVYTGYKGDINSVPWFFKKIKGNSCVTDLRQNIDDIFASMHSTNRKGVRRAEREGYVYEYGYDYDKFIPFFNEFAIGKGLPDRASSEKLSSFGKPIVSMVKYNDEILVMHVTAIIEETKLAYLIYSASGRFSDAESPIIVGRANRYCHFKDLEVMKNMNLNTYDWNGVCLDPDDGRYSIGQFKLSFGGVITDNPCLQTPMFVMMNYIKNMAFKIKHKAV